MPRLKVAAAKPPRSVTIPPPGFIKSEWRVAPCSLRAATRKPESQIFVHVFCSDNDFGGIFSAGMLAVAAGKRRCVCSSVRMKACREDIFRWHASGRFQLLAEDYFLFTHLTYYGLEVCKIMEGSIALFIYYATKIVLFNNKTLSFVSENLCICKVSAP